MSRWWRGERRTGAGVRIAIGRVNQAVGDFEGNRARAPIAHRAGWGV
jgi:hypothetical protein